MGSLVAVVAPSGEAAVYSYDAVSNLLSIARYTSTTVSVVEFTPNAGPTGSSVTIYGTGFSATPSQNTLTFNGVAATVVSSTPTTIVATVPASATTGVISVTSPTAPHRPGRHSAFSACPVFLPSRASARRSAPKALQSR